ncbi:MAG: hypothetical protein EBU90_27310, partial [Proteobacteria bacterium]|nr:hypothetical protein [Pseudomonadota bacterium]
WKNRGKHRDLDGGVVWRKFLPESIGHEPLEQGHCIPEIFRPRGGRAEIGGDERKVVNLIVDLQVHLRAPPEVGEDVLGSPRQNEPVGVQKVIQGRDEVVQFGGVPER